MSATYELSPVRLVEPQACCGDPWEEAYLHFESPAQEVAKFARRLARLGADRWPRDAAIVELFCGRGNGPHALGRLGFANLEGIDLSERLVSQYHGPARWFSANVDALATMIDHERATSEAWLPQSREASHGEWR